MPWYKITQSSHLPVYSIYWQHCFLLSPLTPSAHLQEKIKTSSCYIIYWQHCSLFPPLTPSTHLQKKIQTSSGKDTGNTGLVLCQCKDQHQISHLRMICHSSSFSWSGVDIFSMLSGSMRLYPTNVSRGWCHFNDNRRQEIASIQGFQVLLDDIIRKL